MSIRHSDLLALDTRILEDISSDSEFLIEVCDSFLADAPKRIAEVKAAIAVTDPSALSSAAHAMKSLSSCVGGIRLMEVCRKMEAAGKENDVASAQQLVEQLDANYESVQTALQAYKRAL